MTAAYLFLAASIAIAGYAYVGYPAILSLLRGRRSTGNHQAVVSRIWPAVTITLPVYNEEHVVAETLDAILNLDYPRDRLHVLVISDASTDRTDEIVAAYAGRGVDLMRLSERHGKTAAENAGIGHIRGDIVINTDASVRLRRDALKRLVSAFSDPKVGIASGRDVSVARIGGDANLGESGYVGYEMWVRDLETRVSGIVGASGCFYASRIPLHTEIVPEALSRDFAAPLIARERGYRAVSVSDAVCYVPRLPSLHREYRRKVRTMTRGLETLFYKRHLMNPLRYGTFAWMLLSHKLARWLVPWAALVALISTAVLARELVWPKLVLAASGVVLLSAALGWIWPDDKRAPSIFAVPAYVLSGLMAGLHAWVNALRGDLNPVWEPTRRGPMRVD